MPRGEIVISDQDCKGCDLCVAVCPRGCISLDKDRIGPKGTPVAHFSVPEQCTACGVCGWLCPDWAIEVYKYVETAA